MTNNYIKKTVAAQHMLRAGQEIGTPTLRNIPAQLDIAAQREIAKRQRENAASFAERDSAGSGHMALSIMAEGSLQELQRSLQSMINLVPAAADNNDTKIRTALETAWADQKNNIQNILSIEYKSGVKLFGGSSNAGTQDDFSSAVLSSAALVAESFKGISDFNFIGDSTGNAADALTRLNDVIKKAGQSQADIAKLSGTLSSQRSSAPSTTTAVGQSTRDAAMIARQEARESLQREIMADRTDRKKAILELKPGSVINLQA